jgi:hypothetical protein
MSGSSADQEYPSQSDELTSYPDDPAPQAMVNPAAVPGYSPPPNLAAPLPSTAPPPNPAIPQPPYAPPLNQGVPQPPYGQPSNVGLPPPYPPPNQGGQQSYSSAPWVPYPGQGGAHQPVDSGPRRVPQNLRIAFFVMLAGAAATVLSAAYSLTDIEAVRRTALSASKGVLHESDIDLIVDVSMGGAAVGSLVTAGLWVWMAFACRAGKNWARITATVFFGINLLSYLVGVAGAVLWSGPWVPLALSTATFVIGLAAVVLLWNRSVAPYFAPRVPPGYQPYQGYPPNAPY